MNQSEFLGMPLYGAIDSNSMALLKGCSIILKDVRHHIKDRGAGYVTVKNYVEDDYEFESVLMHRLLLVAFKKEDVLKHLSECKKYVKVMKVMDDSVHVRYKVL